MSRKFQLQIPEPCHEDWNKMTSCNSGKFCNSCQKNVIDFTGMSDQQLVAFFKKPHNDQVCGRFSDEQLNRDFSIPKKRIPWTKYLVQVLLPVFITGMKSYSQGSPKVTVETLQEPGKCLNSEIGKSIIGDTTISSNKIYGQVVDEKGIPVPFATIIIKDTQHGVAADASGNFCINRSGNKKNITLVISSVGYQSSEKKVNIEKNEVVKIELMIQTAVLGEVGLIIVKNPPKKNSRLISNIKYFFKVDSLNINPNPAKPGTEIKIELKRNASSDYLIQLFSLQGQLIKSYGVLNSESGKLSLLLPDIKPGAYLIKIEDKKTRQIQSKKLIVQ